MRCVFAQGANSAERHPGSVFDFHGFSLFIISNRSIYFRWAGIPHVRPSCNLPYLIVY